jgi:glycogen debranching enzyme
MGEAGAPSRSTELGASQYAILSASGALDDRTLVLAHGDTFGVFDRRGELRPGVASRHGVFFDGTRFLSGLLLTLHGRLPLLLSSGIHGENESLFVHQTNPDLRTLSTSLERDVVHIVRRVELVEGRCSITVSLLSYAPERVVLELELAFAADFADVFEVRGAKRPRRGHALPVRSIATGFEVGYLGLDDRFRTTRISFSGQPERTGELAIRYPLALEPGAPHVLELSFAFEQRRAERAIGASFARGGRSKQHDDHARISTSNSAANSWLHRSRVDLAMMTVETEHGPFPYAGVPWFSTPFGRDALITAYQLLWLDPSLAYGVLRFLSAHQADRTADAADAEPGKIVHEMRGGEMAALGEVPFGCYYGSVDATPLFVLLAAATHDRTGDDAFLDSLWPHLERALAWIDGPADVDGDGFVEYVRRSGSGLRNQGWKDSSDSIVHADGSLAEGPIALCEVQGYVYAAKRGLARVARRLGRAERARALEREAEALRAAFSRAFWCPELGTYALALDGDKRPCRVRSSNAGHALFTGIAEPEHAAALASTLLSGEHFSGWGVRTLAASEQRYNPMSYHNGSVWPHDNSLIALGLSRYGETDAASQILGGLFEASRAMEHRRLPELLCGFPLRVGEGPTLYPVACSPQAWSAGASFLLFQATLGLTIEAASREVRFTQPVLPQSIDRVLLEGVSVGEGSVDVRIERAGDHATDLRVLRRSGDVRVVLA